MSKAATADSYSKNMLHQKVFRTIICILFCIIALLPFVLLVMNATRDSESIKAGVSLIPSTHLIENWKNLMIKQNGMQITLQKAIINSATITIPGTFLSVYFSSLTAYGIHVYDFKFKKICMGIYYGSYDGAKSDFHHRFLPFHAGSEADRYIRSADHSYHCSSNCCFLYETVYGKYTFSGDDRGSQNRRFKRVEYL